MTDKKTHFGRAGEFFAMSELLLRGWNVAVPVVDVGDDVFVIDDRHKTTWRVQVKTAAAEPVAARGDGSAMCARAAFTLSREQLRTAYVIELFYMLMIRVADRWRLLVIPREDLHAIRDAHVDGSQARKGPGRRPRADAEAKVDDVTLVVELDGDDVRGWGASLSTYLDRWPEALQIVVGGPGSLRPSTAG